MTLRIKSAAKVALSCIRAARAVKRETDGEDAATFVAVGVLIARANRAANEVLSLIADTTDNPETLPVSVQFIQDDAVSLLEDLTRLERTAKELADVCGCGIMEARGRAFWPMVSTMYHGIEMPEMELNAI